MRLPDPQNVENGLEVEHPALERIPGRILGAVGPCVAARFPENEPMLGGERVAVHVPHVGVAADAVGEHQGGPAAAVLLVIDPRPIVGPGEWHGGILAARGFVAQGFALDRDSGDSVFLNCP